MVTINGSALSTALLVGNLASACSTECEQVRSESRMGYMAVPFVEWGFDGEDRDAVGLIHLSFKE